MIKKNLAPKYLKAETRKWFNSVLENYELESHHLKILILASEAWDRCQQAREEIKKNKKLTIEDRFGQVRSHPAIAIERDNKILFARLIRELGFDIERAGEGNRPPRLY
jgi:phage terminase small subunit